MLADDGLGILTFFSVVAGIILGELKSRTRPKTVGKPVKHRKKRKEKETLSGILKTSNTQKKTLQTQQTQTFWNSTLTINLPFSFPV